MHGVIIQLEYAAQQKNVGARKHMQHALPATKGHIVHSGIGKQEDQLTFGWHQFGVIK